VIVAFTTSELSPNPPAGFVPQFNGSLWIAVDPSGLVTLVGDVSGPVGANKVVAWRNQPLDPVTMAAPAAGNVPIWDGVKWVAQAPAATTSVTMGGDVSGSSAASSVVAWRNKPLDPVTMAAPAAGNVPAWDGAKWVAQAPAATTSVTMGGDVTGNSATSTVVRWENQPLDAPTMGAPGDAQIPVFDSLTGSWRSISLSGGASINRDGIVTVAPTGVTSVSGTAPIVSSGGTTPAISITAATGAAAGSMSAADKTKLDTMTAGAAVSSVSGTAPIVSSGGATPAISINAATDSLPGSMSAADKTTLDSYTNPATTPWMTFQTHKATYYSGMSGAGTITNGMHVWGWNAGNVTQAGSQTAPALATTSKLAATVRVVYSLTAAGSCGISEGGPAWAWRGNIANAGGFKFTARFAIEQASVSSQIFAMIGLVSDTSRNNSFDWTATGTASTARIGMACNATTTAGGALPAQNWKLLESNDSTTITSHDLGAGFALTVNDFIELNLFANANDTKVSYIVNNLTTGATTSGTLNTSLPSNTTFLGPYFRANLNTFTSGTHKFGIAHMFLEGFDG
jgi:hypothetical protein